MSCVTTPPVPHRTRRNIARHVGYGGFLDDPPSTLYVNSAHRHRLSGQHGEHNADHATRDAEHDRELELDLRSTAPDETVTLYLVKWSTLPWVECTWELEKDINDDLKVAQFHRWNLMPSNPVPNVDPSLRISLAHTRQRDPNAPKRKYRKRQKREVVRRLLPKRGLGMPAHSSTFLGLDGSSARFAPAEEDNLVYGPVREGRAGRPPSVIATGILHRAFLLIVTALELTQKYGAACVCCSSASLCRHDHGVTWLRVRVRVCWHRTISQRLNCSGSTVSLWMRGKHRLGGMRLERVYNLLRTESSEAVLPFIETIIDASNNMALQTPLAEVRPRPTLKAAVFVKVPVGELDAEYRLLPIAPPRGDLDPIAYARVLIKRIQTRVAKCVAFCVRAGLAVAASASPPHVCSLPHRRYAAPDADVSTLRRATVQVEAEPEAGASTGYAITREGRLSLQGGMYKCGECGRCVGLCPVPVFVRVCGRVRGTLIAVAHFVTAWVTTDGRAH